MVFTSHGFHVAWASFKGVERHFAHRTAVANQQTALSTPAAAGPRAVWASASRSTGSNFDDLHLGQTLLTIGGHAGDSARRHVRTASRSRQGEARLRQGFQRPTVPAGDHLGFIKGWMKLELRLALFMPPASR